MTSLETGNKPERTEGITEAREVTWTVKPRQRDYLFHREPYMHLDEFGYITVTWPTPWQADFDYYQVLAYRKPGITLSDVEDAMEVWIKKSDYPADPQLKGNGNVLAHVWSTYASFKKPEDAFVLGTKDDKGIALLKIKAAQKPTA